MSDPARPEERITGNPEPVDGLCNAHNRFGLFCPNPPHRGMTRCYAHGGKTPVGAMSPHFKHGRSSRHLPTRIAERFERAQADPELLSTRSNTALIQARIDELLEDVYSGESGSAAKEIFKLWEVFQKHRRLGNVAAMQETLEQLDKPIRQYRMHHQAWDELGLQVDRHARLADQEQRRLDKIQATMTVEEAMGLLGTVLDVLRRHVTDQATLDAIGAELEQLVALDAVPIAARSRRRR